MANGGSPYVNIVVEGCCHGALDEIYASVGQIERRRAVKVDLLICCGDFQALRNEDDYESLAVPPKYRSMESFYKYYKGEKTAPVLTLVIGGNHEASNYMLDLFHGGWLAPNIYYLGAAGVVNFGGLRIAGSSGIFKSGDYRRGNYEVFAGSQGAGPQLASNAVRSAYHTRQSQVFQLAQLARDGAPPLPTARAHGDAAAPGAPRQWVDVFLSHDWPTGVVQFGDSQRLLKAKPFFRDEVASNTLGSPPYEDLLHRLKPQYWFAAHLHCKFAAIIPHQPTPPPHPPPPPTPPPAFSPSPPSSSPPSSSPLPPPPPPTPCVTRFLALDKCLPRRDFLQLVTLPRPNSERPEQEQGSASASPEFRRAVLEYDPEWLAIMRATHVVLSRSPHTAAVPSSCTFVTESDVAAAAALAVAANGSLEIPQNFVATAPAYPERRQSAGSSRGKGYSGGEASAWGVCGNPQTDALLSMLHLPHTVTAPFLTTAAATTVEGIPGVVAAAMATATTAADTSSVSAGGHYGAVGAGAGSHDGAHVAAAAGTVDSNEIDIDDVEEGDDERGGGFGGGEEIVLLASKKEKNGASCDSGGGVVAAAAVTNGDANEIDIDDL